jgi:hypothetical protein
MVLMLGMSSLKNLITADDSPELGMTLANMRVINDLLGDPPAFNKLLQEV